MQGGGSAKVRPDRPSALLAALRDRGYTVSHAAGCRIDKFLPVLRGSFDVELRDAHGGRAATRTDRIEIVRQHHESDGLQGTVSASVSGTIRVDESGTWLFGLRSVGAATVRVDGEVVVAVDGLTRGGSFFGFGSDEEIVEVHLDAGVDHLVEVDYPRPASDGMCGLILGARPASEPDLLTEAVALAADAEVAVVVVGTNDEWETEGEDRTSLALPGRQDELVAAVRAANPNTVVVVNAGSPVAMPWIDDVAAVLQAWFPGGQLGVALTDVISGDVEPGGRLPVTFPRRLEDTPAYEHHPGDGVTAPYSEGLQIGLRWYDRQGIEPLFWFGHGLGYTTFEHGAAHIDGSIGGPLRVSTEVRNSGSRPGHEVVQVYTRYTGDHPDVEPLLRFVGSAKVFAVPGEAVTATVELDGRSFSSWLDGRWHVPAGPHDVLVGRSAGDLTLAATLVG